MYPSKEYEFSSKVKELELSILPSLSPDREQFILLVGELKKEILRLYAENCRLANAVDRS